MENEWKIDSDESDVLIKSRHSLIDYMSGSKNNFKGNPSCSATCAGSISPDPTTPGWDLCDKLVLLYDGQGTFNTLNEPSQRKEAYVYISDKIDFKGFTKSDIKRLSTYGVEKVMIIKYSEDGESYTETSLDFVDIRQLPKIGDSKNEKNITDPKKKAVVVDNSGGSGSNPNTNLFIAILVIIIVLLLIYLASRYIRSY